MGKFIHNLVKGDIPRCIMPVPFYIVCYRGAKLILKKCGSTQKKSGREPITYRFEIKI